MEVAPVRATVNSKLSTLQNAVLILPESQCLLWRATGRSRSVGEDDCIDGRRTQM